MRAAAVSLGTVLGLVVSATALAGPPVQRPTSPVQRSDQPASDQAPAPAPAEVALPPVEPAPADVESSQVEPPPSEPTPADAEPPSEPAPTSAALPRYDAAPSSSEIADAIELPPSDWSDSNPPAFAPRLSMPPPGYGRMAVGAIMFAGGTVLAAVSGSMVVFTEDWSLGIAGAVVSAGSVMSGVILMSAGSVRRKQYRTWAHAYGGEHAIPRPGVGLLAAGTTCVVAGPLGVLVGGISLTLQDERDLPYGQVLIPMGAVSIAGGVAMLVVGAKRKRTFERWHAQHVITPSFSLLPAGIGPGNARIGGASMGFTGRF